MIRLKFTYYFLAILFIFSLLSSCGIRKFIKDKPNLSSYTIKKDSRIEINDSLFYKGENSLRKNSFGQWELVAGGNPLELGNSIGMLTEELIKNQDDIFFSKVQELVPSKFKQHLLSKYLNFYNREMNSYINEEYKAEIYGISMYGSDKNNINEDKYLRSLYLHSAHDLGHALQDLALVGCSSFAAWGNQTADGNLLIARNFDFYVGDAFAEEKVISFIKPEKGYKFMSVSWAGMIGVMSGMNEKGLTVTINAGKSAIPLIAKTPISLVTREVLQYASNIEEAIAIAKKKEIFVSESILVGSAEDNKAVIIEMSPENFGVFEVDNNSRIICSNHFQSSAYVSDANNNRHIIESHSKYRYDRMEELLNENGKVTPEKAISILRNKYGLDNQVIGYGNEKALNQLLAHHGIVFQPQNKMVWVSSNPYQLGEFVAFQLDSVFENSEKKSNSLSISKNLIAKDSFINTLAYKNYELFRIEERHIQKVIRDKGCISISEINAFKKLNPESWKVYNLIGNYYYERKYYKAALIEFEKALTKEISTIPEKRNVENNIKKIKRKLHDS